VTASTSTSADASPAPGHYPRCTARIQDRCRQGY
jgi:hypothetical protein